MKRLSTLFLFLVCMIPMCYAQDVVFFNDGSTLEGEILEVNPSSTLKIKTSDGGTFVVNMSEVDHLSRNGNVGRPSAIKTPVRLIDRHGKDFYWVDNGKKLTDIDYQRELKGDLFKTFNSARSQFSNGGSLLFGGAVLTVIGFAPCNDHDGLIRIIIKQAFTNQIFKVRHPHTSKKKITEPNISMTSVIILLPLVQN